MSKKKETLLQRVTQTITTFFLTGVIVLLPITLTVALIAFSFRMLVKWLEPLKRIADSTPFLNMIPHPEIIVAVFIILVAGLIYNVFLIRTVIHAFEHLLSQIPIIRQVYSGFKQLVHAFSLQDKMTFKQVVMVEFPRKEVYSLGFLTSEFDPSHFDAGNTLEGRLFYNVFIPTTPNPTTGFFVIVPVEQVIKIDISRQEAMAMIISGGIIQPQIKKEFLQDSKNP